MTALNGSTSFDDTVGDTPDDVLVLQHEDDIPPGNLAQWLDGQGICWRRIDMGRQPLPEPVRRRALVVLGSRESVYDPTVPWLPAELAFVRASAELGTPVLGLCFGAQVLATVLGGTVSRAPVPEYGWIDVFATGCGRLVTGRWFEWHRDRITPGPDTIVLAESDHCVQAFYSGPHIGVQFHPEVTTDIVAGWLDEMVNGALNGANGARDVAEQWAQRLVAETRQLEPRATAAAGRVYAKFFDPATQIPQAAAIPLPTNART